MKTRARAAAFACTAVAFFCVATAPTVAQGANDDYAPGRDIVRDFNHIVAENGVEETFDVTLGGAKQVVTVRGADRRNPILLYIHGGPGAAESPFAWAFQRPWEDYFTVVQWDQRGAGRSYLIDDPAALAPTMTLDRIRDDAIALIELLRRRYDQPNVIVLGHSFGSVIGMKVAAKRPDLIGAYVGMGQYIDTEAGEKASYAWTLDQAKRDGNVEAVRELEALQPYPGDTTIQKIDAERKWANHYGGLFWRHRDGDFYFHLARLSPDYTPEQRAAYDKASQFSTELLEKQLKGLTFVPLTKLECPVYLLLGRHDGLTPSEVAASWLDRVEAPQKGRFWFENSAHMAMIEEPGRVLEALLQVRREAARRDGRSKVVDRHAQ